jgi:hypothetical protein
MGVIRYTDINGVVHVITTKDKKHKEKQSKVVSGEIAYDSMDEPFRLVEKRVAKTESADRLANEKAKMGESYNIVKAEKKRLREILKADKLIEKKAKRNEAIEKLAEKKREGELQKSFELVQKRVMKTEIADRLAEEKSKKRESDRIVKAEKKRLNEILKADRLANEKSKSEKIRRAKSWKKQTTYKFNRSSPLSKRLRKLF